jgi:hypothetical protein
MKLTPLLCTQCGAPLDENNRCPHCNTRFVFENDYESPRMPTPGWMSPGLLSCTSAYSVFNSFFTCNVGGSVHYDDDGDPFDDDDNPFGDNYGKGDVPVGKI